MKIDNKKIDWLYVATTKDRYELPIAVADSVKELSEMIGVPARTISVLMSPINQKNRPHSGFYKVFVGDED